MDIAQNGNRVSQYGRNYLDHQFALSDDSPPCNREHTIREIQTIIYQLEKVQDGTTVYQEAQYLLESAQNKLRQLEG